VTGKAAQKGFTLVELMVSLVIFSFAIAGVLAVAVAMTRAFREQRRVVATENAVRAPLDFIVDALRQASPGVTTGTITDGQDCSFTAGAISFVDNTTAPDELTIVYASGGVVSTTHSVVDGSSTSITIPTEHVAQFAVGDYVLVTDGAQGTLVAVTSVGTDALGIAPTCTTAFPGAGYPAGSMLIRAQRARFVIEDLDGIPTLKLYANGATSDAEPVAEGVEDLQVALGVDADGDGAVTGDILAYGTGTTSDEWIGNASGDVLPAGAIRAVHVVLVSRDTSPLRGTASFYEPADALNHTGSTTADNFRRRMLNSTVEIRNLTGSP
jgi:prepilin-type N-terminal cleavage/methylation domain-containing protein